MSSDPQDNLRDRIFELTELCLWETAAPEQIEELERLLQTNSDARQYYLKYIYDAQSLRDWTLAQSEPAATQVSNNQPKSKQSGVQSASDQPPVVASKKQRNKIKRRERRRANNQRLMMFGAVSVVTCALALTFILRREAPRAEINSEDTAAVAATVTESATAVATVTKTVQTRWQGADDFGIGSALNANQQLNLLAGIAELRFADGATMTVQGPATFEMLSPQSAHLHSGMLTAYVPPAAVGFRIHTPALDIVDLGTSFGVAVQPSTDTDVSVFSGSVEVRLPNKDRQAAQVVEQGKSVRVTAQQQSIESVDFEETEFQEPLKVSTGIESLEGDVRFISTRITGGRHPAKDPQVLIGLERRDFALPQDLTVNLRPELGDPVKSRATPIPAGTRVHCFLIQFDPPGPRQRPRGRAATFRATFDQPIIGIIAGGAILKESDRYFADVSPQLTVRQRGSESPSPDEFERDELVVSDDYRTIEATARVFKNMDQTRFIVAAPQPDAETTNTQSTHQPEEE